MSLALKIFSNTAWQIVGRIVTAALGIVSIKFITNYLSTTAYGEYTIIYDYTALFAIIADFGLFTIAVREMAHSNQKELIQKIVGNVLSIRTTLALTAFTLGILISLFIPAYHGSQIPLGIIIVSLATIITLVGGTMSSVLQFHLRMYWASIGISLGKLVTVGYIVFTILYLYPHNPEQGFIHLLGAWIFGALVTLIITFVASQKLIHIRFQFDFKYWKEVLIKALPYGLALVLGTIYFRMGTLSLSFFKLKEDAGFYGVPLRFLEILQIIPHYFMNSVLPILTISLATDMVRARRVIRYSLNALAALAFPIFIGGYLLAWPLTVAVSSSDFVTTRLADGSLIYGSDMALKILLGAMAFTYLHVALSYILVAMGHQIELLWINAIVVAINGFSNFILVPRFGFIGAAASAVISEFFMCIMLAVRVRRRIQGIWHFAFIGKTIFAALTMGVVLYLTTDYLDAVFGAKSLFILLPLGGIVFALSLLATKAVSKEMIGMLRRTAPGEVPE